MLGQLSKQPRLLQLNLRFQAAEQQRASRQGRQQRQSANCPGRVVAPGSSSCRRPAAADADLLPPARPCVALTVLDAACHIPWNLPGGAAAGAGPLAPSTVPPRRLHSCGGHLLCVHGSGGCHQGCSRQGSGGGKAAGSGHILCGWHVAGLSGLCCWRYSSGQGCSGRVRDARHVLSAAIQLTEAQNGEERSRLHRGAWLSGWRHRTHGLCDV